MNHHVTGAALAPLGLRYQRWLSLDQEQVLTDREEAAEDIRAMQLIVRMERDAAPSWHLALAAAASGAARLCLDERAEPEGEWFQAIRDYCTGHIRKVTRRARAGHWEAAQDLPGTTVGAAGTQVRALLPGLVTELDKRISRLQVGGTDIEPDAAPAEVEPSATLRVWLPPEPVMTLGKAMAQTGHAGMIAAALLAAKDRDALQRWHDADLPVTVRRADAGRWAELVGQAGEDSWDGGLRLLAVRDAGFTEVAPGTVTVMAAAPS